MIRNMSSSKHHTLSKEEEESESSQSEKDGSNVSASEKVELFRIHPSLIGMAKPAAESRGENQPAGSQMDKPPVQTTSTSTTLPYSSSSTSTSSALGQATRSTTTPRQQTAAASLPMATQQVALSYLPQAQAPALATSSLDVSLLNQRSSVPRLMTGFTNMPQAPSQLSSLQLHPALRDQLQLASLAQNQNVVGLPQQQQQVSNQAPLSAAASSRIALVEQLLAEQLTAVLLGQLAANQTNTHQNMVGSAAASLLMSNQQAALSYLPQSQARTQDPTRTSNFDVSLLNRLSSVQMPPAGLRHMPQTQTPSQSSPLQPASLDQMQLASLVQNVATPSLLNQLLAAQAHAYQGSHLQPTQSTSALTNMYLLQQLSAPQNPLQQVHAYHNLHLQQRYAPQNPGALLPIAMQYQSQPVQRLAPAHTMNQLNQMELYFQNMGANPASNTGNAHRSMIPVAAASAASSTGSTNQGTTPVAAAVASAASSNYTHPIQADMSSRLWERLPRLDTETHTHTSPENTRNNNSAARAANSMADSETSAEATAPEQASQGQLHLPHRSKAKEKRWLIRYEELEQFQQKFGHCLVPHGYSENRKLSWWVMNQRAQYQLLRQGRHAWLTEDRVRMLDILGFEWNPTHKGG